MATKRVLVDTRAIGWGSDTRLYLSADQLGKELPARLASGPVVLKQERGMGGQGVWKVTIDRPGADPIVRVEDATAPGEELIPLSSFAERCRPYFADGGVMVEQPYQPRITEGMIRAYLTHDKVVGFAHQYPRGLRPANAAEPPPRKVFHAADAEAFQPLRRLLESRWVPQMQTMLGLETDLLPVIWDADFLYGPQNDAGADRYILCEINASSTFAFPEHAMPGVAEAALKGIEAGS
jgi:hypothetical protein